MQQRDVKQVMVLELWNIGDTVLLLPFLQQLRVIFPSARTVLVARAYAKELLAPSGLVDEFIPTNLGWQRTGTSWNPLAYPWRELWRVVSQIRRQRFDIAFQCRPHVREYLILALSGAKRRVGMSMPLWGRLLTDRISIDPLTTQKKDCWIRLLGPLGGRREIPPPKLSVEPAAREHASRFLAARGVSAQTVLIGVHPGASVPEKRWPIERFGEVVEEMSRKADVRVLVFSEPGGYGRALDGTDGRILAQVDLPDMVALLERCKILVCNDSGPMHIAGALGVPCVAVFSAGIDSMFAPLGEGHQILVQVHSPPGRGLPERGPPPYDVTRVPTSTVMGAIEQLLG